MEDLPANHPLYGSEQSKSGLGICDQSVSYTQLDVYKRQTICAPENPVAIPFQKISEPTIAMNFMVNDSPLAGQEGKFVTSRHLRERLLSLIHI